MSEQAQIEYSLRTDILGYSTCVLAPVSGFFAVGGAAGLPLYHIFGFEYEAELAETVLAWSVAGLLTSLVLFVAFIASIDADADKIISREETRKKAENDAYMIGL